MAEQVVESIRIEADPERVWEVVMDPERLGEWVSIHDRVEDVPPGPLESGSEFAQTIKLGGVKLRVRWRVTACERPLRARWHGKGPRGTGASISYELSGEDGATVFDYCNEFELPGGIAGRAASRVFGATAGGREARKTLRRLKQLIEANRR